MSPKHIRESNMKMKRACVLCLVLAPTLSVSIAAARAEEAVTSVTSSAALHSPQVCDLNLTLGEVAKIHASKAAKRYKISYSMVSLAGYFYQATAYGAVKAAEEAGEELSVYASH